MKGIVLFPLLLVALVGCTPAQLESLDRAAARTFSGCMGFFPSRNLNPSGYTVSSLQSGSPAQAATIREGDVVVSVNGIAATELITDGRSNAVLPSFSPGDVVTVKHARNRLGLYWDYYDSRVTLGRLGSSGNQGCISVR